MGASPAVQTSGGRIGALDGLRAIAIVSVIAFHAGVITRFPVDLLGWGMPLVVNGWMGVDLFFALSGFLITHLWIRDEESSGGGAAAARTMLARFYVRRVLRILPPLYLMLLFDLWVLPSLGQFPTVAPLARAVRERPGAVLPFVFLYMNYLRHSAAGLGFSQLWSLCVEEHFYLLWPLCLVLVRARRRRLTMALGVCAAIAIARGWAAATMHPGGWATPVMLYRNTHTRVDSILWGAASAIALEDLRPRTRLRRAGLAIAAAVVVLLVALGRLSINVPTGIGTGLGFTAIAVAFTLVVLEVILTPDSVVARVFAWRPLRAIGFVSYAMYLFHPVAIEVATRIVFAFWASMSPYNFLLVLAASVAVSFGMALVTYVAVERPAASLRRRLERSIAASR